MTSVRVKRHAMRLFFWLKVCRLKIEIVQQMKNALKWLNFIIKIMILLLYQEMKIIFIWRQELTVRTYVHVKDSPYIPYVQYESKKLCIRYILHSSAKFHKYCLFNPRGLFLQLKLVPKNSITVEDIWELLNPVFKYIMSIKKISWWKLFPI